MCILLRIYSDIVAMLLWFGKIQFFSHLCLLPSPIKGNSFILEMIRLEHNNHLIEQSFVMKFSKVFAFAFVVVFSIFATQILAAPQPEPVAAPQPEPVS